MYVHSDKANSFLQLFLANLLTENRIKRGESSPNLGKDVSKVETQFCSPRLMPLKKCIIESFLLKG